MKEEAGERIEGGGLLITKPRSGVSVPEDGDDGDIVIAGEKEEVEKEGVEKEEGEKEEEEEEEGMGVGGEAS